MKNCPADEVDDSLQYSDVATQLHKMLDLCSTEYQRC